MVKVTFGKHLKNQIILKGAISVIVLLMLLFAMSCKKSSSTVNLWTFKGTTFNAYSVMDSNIAGANGVMTALSPQGTLVINFDGTLPTFDGTYAAAYPGTLTVYNQVSFQLTTVGNQVYYSTGGNGNEPVYVSISSTGKINMSATGIEMASSTTPGDSAAININIIQTQ